MNETTYTFIKLTAGVIATFGLYSVLARENKFYRFFEHLFLGLAAGWILVSQWTEILKPIWWDIMLGKRAETAQVAIDGYWVWALLLPFSLMAFLAYSKKYAWMSRIPIGVYLGLWAGQQPGVFWTKYGPQIKNSILPIIPTDSSSFTVPVRPDGVVWTPEQLALVKGAVYPSQAIGNLVAIITILCVLSYFFFSFDVKNKILLNTSRMGRYLLMIGFGAIFGNTVMMRFTLLIDRMYFACVEWPDAVKLFFHL